MSDVFISYSRRDSVIADELARRLDRAGHRIWMDRSHIDAGTQWRPELAQAIRDCGIFILLLSPDSACSRHVARELSLAEDNEKAVIPVEIAALKIPAHLEYHLTGMQRVDLKGGLDAGLSRLLEAMVGAPERAAAMAARFDQSMNPLDREFGAAMLDSAGLGAKRVELMKELARIDEADAQRGCSDPTSADRRERILRQMDELTRRSGEKIREAQRLQHESFRAIEALSKRKKDGES